MGNRLSKRVPQRIYLSARREYMDFKAGVVRRNALTQPNGRRRLSVGPGQRLELAHDPLEPRPFRVEQCLQRGRERMLGIQLDMLLCAGADAFDYTSLNQASDRQLNGAQMLPRPASEFANRHRFPRLLQDPQNPDVTLYAQDRVPRCS
ncbi:MAG: hypothetical protein HY337_04075 [Gemmatimonadetes bacterium]|nr:hypothetical protein [Gemmatimonadota bacterium]